MRFVKPVVGAILLVLGLLTVPQVFSAAKAEAFQLGIFAGGYLGAGGLVLAGRELGAWGAILIPAVTLVTVAAMVVQAPAGVEIPLQSWVGLVANVIVLVGGVVLVRSDKPSRQSA